MSRGIYLNFDSSKEHIFGTVMTALNMPNYIWNITETEIYNTNSKERVIIEKFQSSCELTSLICKPLVVIFSRMLRINKKAMETKYIDTYEDFLLSDNCDCIVLCTDYSHYEIYLKSIDEINRLYNVYHELDCNCELITDENDGRYTFHVDV